MILTMLNMYQKKPTGRPKLNKADPNITHMRVTAELKELLMASREGRETMAECCLRLIRSRAPLLKKVTALERELEDSNIQYTEMQKRFGPETISV